MSRQSSKVGTGRPDIRIVPRAPLVPPLVPRPRPALTIGLDTAGASSPTAPLAPRAQRPVLWIHEEWDPIAKKGSDQDVLVAPDAIPDLAPGAVLDL